MLRLILTSLAILLAVPAEAREYSVDVDVIDEQELRQLYFDGQLDDEEFQTLIALLESPIDLNLSARQDIYQLPGVSDGVASAIVDERTLNGPYAFLGDVAARVEAVDSKLIDQIRPFVILRLPKGEKPAARGSFQFLLAKTFEATRPIEDDHPAKSHSARQLGYGNVPAMMFGGGAELLGWLDFGVIGTIQEGLNRIEYEPTSGDFTGQYGAPTFRPHSGYIRVTRPKGSVLLGSYHLSFGHGLVMSTLGGRDRHGFTIRRNGTGDGDRIREHNGMLGVVARAYPVKAGRAELDLTAFGSLRNYDQYVGYVGMSDGEVLDPADPDIEVRSPRVWVDGQKSAYMTLPALFRVGLAGGNATLRFNRRTQIGITGYGAFVDRAIVEGIEDQNTILLRQRFPNSRGWGSFGVHGGFGVWIFDFSAEYGLFMHEGNPANAFYFVMEAEPAWGEFVFSVRHYDEGYGNPFNRGEANPDKLAGNTARNEQGLRFQATIKPDRSFRFQVRADLARNIRYDVHDFDLRGSVRGEPLPWLQLGVLLRYANQNLAISGRQHTYSGTLADFDLASYRTVELEDDDGTTVPRAGEKISWTGQLRVQGKKWGNVTLRYRQEFTDNAKSFEAEGQCSRDLQRGHSVRLTTRVKPTKTTTLAGGVVYFDEDWDGDRGNGAENGPHAAFGYVQIEQKIKDRVKLKLRGGVGRRLPDAPSACDEGDEIPDYGFLYEPDEFDLRYFGDLLFTVTVKF